MSIGKEKKEAIIMAAISTTETEKLYKILDEFIGVFRYETMPEEAQEFYQNKKQDFINIFTKEIPESYWFQGTDFSSVNLVFHPIEGFKVVSSVAHDHLKTIIEKTNGRINTLNSQLIPA